MAMAISTNRRRPHSLPKHGLFLSLFTTAILALSVDPSQETHETIIDYGNHNLEWEDGPSSWEEFGHDNDPSVCGLPVLTVEEWEA
eukprot:CAMPEP_0201883222 /NCGR_PEP_ID=MMETSP0902-20130614/15220_1 /ASSEMBLY_ACC=CAM_ASM_000551 /TAXON_ID=420261 /ORGANISM="Thalassiosira antarctica, Strain CCMP982" /LENGTH=85 /DNA_ID=CAMNT_0048411957 /DNA_START=29 /DNA_END=282 /DNA_ORIENTATION=-